MPERIHFPVIMEFDRSAPKAKQIERQIRAAWESGVLAQGTQIPSVRALADDLQVSKSTVSRAYQALEADGVLEIRFKSGCVIARASGAPGRASPVCETTPSLRPSRRSARALLPEERLWEKPASPLLPWLTLMNREPDPHWQRIVSRIVRAPWRHHGHCPPAGLPALREAIAKRLATYRGFRTEPESIFITNGTVHGFSLLAQALFDEGDPVGIESPSPAGLCNALRYQGCDLKGIPVDQNGCQPPAQAGLRGLVVTPCCQVPTGLRMSPERKKALLDWSRRAGAWLIENDLDSEFSSAAPSSPIRALPGAAANVIFSGTFSHILFTGIRMGFLAVPASLVPILSGIRAMTGRFSAEPMQAAVCEYMERGFFDAYFRRVNRIYGARRSLTASLCKSELAPYGSLCNNGPGSRLTLKLDPMISDKQACARLLRRGVSVSPLSSFAMQPDPPLNGLVLGSGAFSEEEIRKAVAEIRSVLGEFSP